MNCNCSIEPQICVTEHCIPFFITNHVAGVCSFPQILFLSISFFSVRWYYYSRLDRFVAANTTQSYLLCPSPDGSALCVLMIG